jgi:hypothetical protein
LTGLPVLSPATMWYVTLAAAAVASLALVIGVVATVRARRAGRRLDELEAHYGRVMQGVEGQDLAAALDAHVRRLASAEARIAALEGRAEDLDGRLRRAVTRVRLLRFRAFEDGGGDQSFALALLDEGADGAVLSGIHGRGGIRVYAKPVAGGQSSYNLSAEEAQVIAAAAGEAG